MKLGIIRSNEAKSFDFAREKGLDFIEICTNFDNESEAFIASADEILANIDRTGIPVLSVGRWNSTPNDCGKANPDVMNMLKRQIDVTAKIGCPVFNMGVNYCEELSLFKNYALAIEVLREMVEYAGERGVTLAVYNCSWNNFIYDDKTWEVVLGDIPELMLKYDCSHSYYRGEDYLANIEKWCSRFAHMHVKGTCAIGGRYVDDPPAGVDFLEWSKIFALLYARGYDKTLSLEPHSGIWQGKLGENGIDFSINYIKPFIMR